VVKQLDLGLIKKSNQTILSCRLHSFGGGAPPTGTHFKPGFEMGRSLLFFGCVIVVVGLVFECLAVGSTSR
jgi:hypothetical protein